MNIYDVEISELIKRTSEELKKIEIIKAPDWAMFVKTGPSRERPPVELDWWYMRVASVLRKVAVLGPIGVNKLRRKYGGMKNRGHSPDRYYKGSGKIIRVVLQQLEKAELIKAAEKGVHKGKVVTPKGVKFLNNIVKEIKGNSKVEEKPKEVPKVEVKVEKPVKEKENEQIHTERKEKQASQEVKAK
tara:strand:+ start:487 stop:1047 length:561 start_codon:yes stop_codon:yes gene_type:complete